RHTRSKRDWSADVCSSDLIEHSAEIAGTASAGRAGAPDGPGEGDGTGEADDSAPSGDDNEDDVGRGDDRAASDADRAGDEGSSRRQGGSPQDLTDGSEQRKLTT